MNRSGVLESLPVQQMMGTGNPNNWWNMMNSIRPPLTQQSSSSSSPPPFFSSVPSNNLFSQYTDVPSSSTSLSALLNLSSSFHDNQDLPESWTQLLSGGLMGEEDQKSGMTQLFQAKKMQENWEELQLLSSQTPNTSVNDHVVLKQEDRYMGSSGCVYGNGGGSSEDFPAAGKRGWSQVMPSASSPRSCLTTSFLSSNNMSDFSNKPSDHERHLPVPADRSSECNSTATGGTVKKARVQLSSTQVTVKVRKEKLGDRITALHQLVSPFGKTDTASVLLEAIGYIRFLQSQIEALSLPYLGTGSGNMRHHHSVIQGERNCLFPEDPGQLLNDNCTKRKGCFEQGFNEEPPKDLRSRGLCLVPVSYTMKVGSDNGADYWAPNLHGGSLGFR